MKSPSSLVFDFLTDVVGGVTDSAALLYQAEILDSRSQKMTKDRGIVVSNSQFDLPVRGQTDRTFSDALVVIAFWVHINAKDLTARMPHRDQCFEMARYVADKINEGNYSLGNRVCDSTIERVTDGIRNVTSTEYAVINMPLILNPTGDAVSYSIGEGQ